jgi:hypothetical protein
MSTLPQKRTLVQPVGGRVDKLRCPPGRINLLYGPKPVFHISHGVAGEQLLRNRKVAVIDGANRFSPHTIAMIARRNRVDPEEMLSRIAVSRAFTCYQMESAVTDRAPAFLEHCDCSLLIVFGPLDLFYDEQAPMRDVHRGLRHMLDTLDLLKQRDIAQRAMRCSSARNRKDHSKVNATFTALFSTRDCATRIASRHLSRGN